MMFISKHKQRVMQMSIMNITTTRIEIDHRDTTSNDYVVEYRTFNDNTIRRVSYLRYDDAMRRAMILRTRAYRDVNVRKMFIM